MLADTKEVHCVIRSRKLKDKQCHDQTKKQ